MSGGETDPLGILDSMEPMREAIRGMVALLVADGFTDDQARELVASLFAAERKSGGAP